MQAFHSLRSALARPFAHRGGRRRWLAAIASFAFALAGVGLSLDAAAERGEREDHGNWVGTWAASPQLAAAPYAFNGQTVREIVHTSVGGNRVRVRISNAYGSEPLVIGAAHVAIRSSGPAIAGATDRTLTFNGATHVTVPSYGLVLSDPVSLRVPELGDLAVSLYLPRSVRGLTEHSLGVQSTYISTAGNFTGAATFVPAATTTSFYFLSGVEVGTEERGKAIVMLGDSITDGYASTTDANRRWPNHLAERLQARRGPYTLAVLNAGISGNRVLHDFIGTNALARLDRDVLVQTGVRFVTVLEGINDIGLPGAFGLPTEQVTADEIITGHRQIVDRLHALGLKAIGCTLTPFEGTIFPGYYSSEGEAKRQAVNRWIRTSGAYDAVIDFDVATRDPTHPTRLRPAYDSGDHLHPNDTGYRAMADSIDLSIFREDD